MRHAKAWKAPVRNTVQEVSISRAPVKYTRQEVFIRTSQGISKRTDEISELFPPEITRAAKGPPPKAAFSNTSAKITDIATKAIPNAAVNIEVIEEVETEDILALSADESASSQEDSTEIRTVRELTEVLLEKDNPIEIEACTSADVDPLSGTSSHNSGKPHSRGRTQHREPSGCRDSMTPPDN